MEHLPTTTVQDFINVAATLFNGLSPVFAAIIGIGVGIGLIRYITKAVYDAVDGPVVSSGVIEYRKAKESVSGWAEKPKNSDLLWPEKPKNTEVSFGDDGELVYRDSSQKGDEFFHQ